MGAGNSNLYQNTQVKETLGDHSSSVNCMALSEDLSVIVTGSEDNTARMWTLNGSTDCIGVFR